MRKFNSENSNNKKESCSILLDHTYIYKELSMEGTMSKELQEKDPGFRFGTKDVTSIVLLPFMVCLLDGANKEWADRYPVAAQGSRQAVEEIEEGEEEER